MFDLFQLHDPEKDKRSRGWIRLGGKRLMEEVKNIIKETTDKSGSLSVISKMISDELKINFYTIYNQLGQVVNPTNH